MRLWEDAKRDKAQQLFDYIRSLAVIADKSTSWPWPNIALDCAIREFCYTASDKGLATLIDAPSLMGFPTDFSHVMGPRVTTLEEFERSFEDYLKLRSKQSGYETWKFYMPMYIERGDDVPRPTRIRIYETDFWFLPLSSVLKQVPRKDFLERATLENVGGRSQKVKAPDLYLVMSGQGPSRRAAWQQVEPAFDTLRGLMEFTFGFGNWRYSSHQQPRSKIPHPQWIAALGPEKADKLTSVDFLIEPYYRAQPFELTGELFSLLKIDAKLLRTVPETKSTLALLAKCLRLYVQAMDAPLAHHCLIGLWQLAEAITLAEESGGQSQRVVSRLAWHTSKELEGIGLHDTLRAIAKKRNDIVHQGIHGVNDSDVNILKLVCEMATMWLAGANKKLPTIQHVRKFYSYRTKNSTDLGVAEQGGCLNKQVVRYVREKRN